MSKFTTEVRFICESVNGLNESAGGNSVDEIIHNSLPYVFNFDFPIFDENYREVIETKILKHFYTREIGEETVGLWKLRLNTRLNEIMPFYNQLYRSELLEFNPLYTYNMTRTTKRTGNGTNEGNVATTGNSTSDGNGTGITNGTDRELYSDTPQGALNGVESETYLTNATKNINYATNTTTTHNSSNNNGSIVNHDSYNNLEDYIENVSGFSGVSASKLLKEFRETFLNIDVMILENLEDLFFQLW